ncbi:glucoamylase family protein [Amorphus sp. 3PC139-8]|uniref:glucoamylase family protein n=1 Tax=Amorphus sp. 3PC139-8 TaxID=2735676 RepID=UPI00345D0DCF
MMHAAAPDPTGPDEDALEFVQRETFRFFWEGAHPTSGLARDRCLNSADPAPDDDLVAIGGSGFGIFAIVVATERGWIDRSAALERLSRMVFALETARSHHGVFPHFMNGRTGETIPFGPEDDGGDLVETSFLIQGLLTAQRYFDRPDATETDLRTRITKLWHDVEWSWHTRGGQPVLTWHWSPNHGFRINHEIRGWNECLITYVLAAASPTHPIAPEVYHHGFASSPTFANGRTYYGVELPLGPPLGGPLFFAHYSFCGLDPRGLSDRYADYFAQNIAHTRINHAYCRENPGGHRGYGDACWGLTASDDPDGYVAHAPDRDTGAISPTAALSSFPYAPDLAMRTLRHFLYERGSQIFGRYGFVDAFSDDRDWVADTFLAIDQGPIIAMIENHRSGLLWRLFMSDPDVQRGLARLGFESPHLSGKEAAAPWTS